jgi:HEAT repeat protein
MQLLLLTVMDCADPDAPFLLAPFGQVLSEEDGNSVADALLLEAETEEESLLGHLYKLHWGDRNERIRHALLVGERKDVAIDVTLHLIEELASRDTRVVQEAITALGMIGPAAKDAIPTLEKLTGHEDKQVAERAKAALRQIRGG